MNMHVKFVTFNCKNIIRSAECVRKICETADIVALQETWLLPHDIPFLDTISDKFAYTGKSAVDTSAGVLRGRPYGGVAVLWRKSVFPSVSVLKCNSDRIAAIRVEIHERSMLILSVYMPTDSKDNLIEFTECLSEINSIIEISDVESMYVLGDFNAHPGESFALQLLDFCAEQSWTCVDLDLLPNDSHTFVSEAHGCRRWLDHCVVTSAARSTIDNVTILYDTYWSDHYPMQLTCNLNLIKTKILTSTEFKNNVMWGEREPRQIEAYHSYCHANLRLIDFPPELATCADKRCNCDLHKSLINEMYKNIVRILSEGAESSCNAVLNPGKHIIGWNKHVREAHGRARQCYRNWLLYGKPNSGQLYNEMTESRRLFKVKLKWCQNNQQQIKMDIIARHHSNNNFSKFWKSTNKLNLKPSRPVSVEGEHKPDDIARLFQRHFRVEPSVIPVQSEEMSVSDAGAIPGDIDVRFTAKDVDIVIKSMKRGKSPGHDGLSIEHLRFAGVHLPRVLALLFNLCINHSYLPHDLMYTIVVPIVKNRTGNVSDRSNYRPISLATVIAKVMDSLLDGHLAKHIKLHDGQFGFRTGLSTESAILCLKQTVQYYTARKTPVYACFLDLSRAFDLVSYDLLWTKMSQDTSLPPEIVSIFKYWYKNQKNTVRWAASRSDEYKLECGVRQGGLTSPKLFNLYMDRLIGELSSSGIGCHIDGICVNNISYADDMALLSPSIGALRKLLRMCEEYAGAHGLKYNVEKSEILVFKAPRKEVTGLPPVSLYGTPLNQVTHFKYLGHWVTEDLKDDMDVERERRALSVRCNMLARRFARCTEQVKVTLFRAFCQTFYTCSLWAKYTRRTYDALRVQYNNAFRVLMGLPRYCSASGMYAEARVDGFHAVIRKRSASLLARVRGSPSAILTACADRADSVLMAHLISLHARASA
ncbi:hypothetical protein PYW08_015628 [Mythimna loreyi]|uniref:Uncharacterized protein n=1 Tax=Mythimna loreyi TaxID=667449 RepID=A0ACC2QWR6_9NEOP|nr:hypothetical protein PYW08_015628 [Mythimna loreyi]